MKSVFQIVFKIYKSIVCEECYVVGQFFFTYIINNGNFDLVFEFQTVSLGV